MMVTYTTESTSKQSSEVNKVVLKETSTTRRTLQTTLVKNSENPEASLRISIIYERKGENGFESENPPDLRRIQAGEGFSCELGSSDTLALYKELSRLYALVGEVGVDYGKNQYIIVKANESTSLSDDNLSCLVQLLNNNQNIISLSKELAKLNPELIENAHSFQLLEKKIKGIKRFKEMLEGYCKEQEWQNLFKEHDWILGSVHDIQYLAEISDQPIFSGADVQGKGERRGDFLVCTPGKARFTAVIEIKKADTPLLKPSPYRQVYCPSDELNGGLAQLRDYLRKWHLDGSRSEENKDRLEEERIYTVQPLGILVIGNLDEIKECRKKREAFELFRQNQKDVYIITFDELFSRALELSGIGTE